MDLVDMLNDLPTARDVGTKKNGKGFKVSWIGYKIHIDVTDGGIPISAVLTSASTHDSIIDVPVMKAASYELTVVLAHS